MPIDIIHPSEYGDPEQPHSRIRWTPASSDLHVNLVDLRAGEEIGEHMNASLDVLVTCLEGGGMLVVDDQSVEVTAGSVAVIPMGSRRGIIAGERGMRYTTCHRKRGGLMPTVSNPRRS